MPRWKVAEPGAVAVVLCVETDDYTYPRGIRVPGGAEFAFHSLYASCDCPAGVEVGMAYLVHVDGARKGMVIAELVEQNSPDIEAARVEMCAHARRTGGHDFVPFNGRESCRSCGMARPLWGRRGAA